MASIGTMLTLRLSPAPRPLASAVFLAPAPTLAATPDERRERRERRERVDSSDNSRAVAKYDSVTTCLELPRLTHGTEDCTKRKMKCVRSSVTIFVEGIGEIRTGVETNMHHDML